MKYIILSLSLFLVACNENKESKIISFNCFEYETIITPIVISSAAMTISSASMDIISNSTDKKSKALKCQGYIN